MRLDRQNIQIIVLLVLCWTLLALSFGAISYSVASDKDVSVAAAPIFVNNLVKFFLWAILAPVIFIITKRFPFDGSRPFHVSFAVHLVACVIVSGIHTNFFQLIMWASDMSFMTRDPLPANLFQDSLFFGNFYLGILLYALIVLIVQAYLLITKNQLEATRNAEMKTELANAHLQALKMQLQPHFLFNALHSIAYLNAVDPKQAGKMIARLGEFLRLTLERSNEQMVTLREEVEFLRYYLEIEQIRFSDRLTVEFNIDSATESAEVPHLILQPLVENAVKHGIAPFDGEGKIEIVSRKKDDILILQIKNNANNSTEQIQTKQHSSGTGLKNIRSRLTKIYAENFRFELYKNDANEMIAEIDLPFKTIADAVILLND